MAKPDTDDGWLKYAHELDAALAVADFTKGARIVLREVFAQIYGPAKHRTAKLSPTDIAARVGNHREAIARAIRELVDSGVLSRREDGSYRFHKDYERWTNRGVPRLSRTEIAWCQDAPAQALGQRPGAGNASTEDRNSPVTPGVTIQLTHQPEGVTNELRDRNSSVTENVTGLLRADDAPPDPLKGNGRAEFKTGDIETSKTGDGMLSTQAKDLESFAVAALGRDRFDLESFGQKIAPWLGMGYPAEWVRDAIQLAAVNARPGGAAQYVNACLLRWRKAGRSTAEQAQLDRLKAEARDNEFVFEKAGPVDPNSPFLKHRPKRAHP